MATSLSNPFASEYRFLFDSCIIRPEKFPEIDKTVDQMLLHKTRYQQVADRLGIPWNFIAIVHCMEGSLSFARHLHNGDPLSARTVQVPKGRPVKGTPPFTWEESATDALLVDGFANKTDWSVTSMLYYFEKFNGMGYRKKGIHSPYLWSYSNHYSKGKFTADGVFNPMAVSKQVGAAVLLRRMSEKQIAVRGETDRITQIKNLGEQVKYDPKRTNEKARELQQLLNSIGLHLRIDGQAGNQTSDAYFAIAGKYLPGDSRNK